jgi:ubiquitin C-terminal hydrolase
MEELSKYKKFTKALLKKFNDTSYLNAVLQCLGNLYDLANFFLNPVNNSNLNDNVGKFPLSFVISRLYEHFYPFPEQDKIEYGNEKILCILSKYNVGYNNVNKQNPNDLIILLLDLIHSELNIKNSKNNNVDKNSDEYDYKSTLQFGIINFFNNNNSIISHLFTHFEIKEYHCLDCKKIKYDFLNFKTYDLDILGTINNKGNNGAINLYDCLDYFCKNKNKKLLCKKCKNTTNMEIISKIYSSPRYFVFLLDRGNLDQNLKIKFDLEEKIDLNNYIESAKAPKKFDLIGIVSISVRENKYVAFSKSPIDQNWYLYNDEKEVEQIDINLVKDNNTDLYSYVPCILFYKHGKQ